MKVLVRLVLGVLLLCSMPFVMALLKPYFGEWSMWVGFFGVSALAGAMLPSLSSDNGDALSAPLAVEESLDGEYDPMKNLSQDTSTNPNYSYLSYNVYHRD